MGLPRGGHDDYVNVLALAAASLSEPPREAIRWKGATLVDAFLWNYTDANYCAPHNALPEPPFWLDLLV